MSARLRLQVRRYARHFAVLLALISLGIAAGFYILGQERLPNPFQTYYSVNGAFSSAAGVVGGLGEPVNVAGVRVGQIVGTSLSAGQAIVRMQIDPTKIKELYRDAHAELVPKTPLQDMQVDIAPGDPSAGALPHGATISIGQSTTPINADELLSSLDADTRTWLASLITELSEGLSGRARDIRSLLRALGPTSSQLRQVGDLLASRRRELAVLVHNFGLLTKAVSKKDAQLATTVRAGAVTFHALAEQDVALHQSVVRLPGTLTTTGTTLGDLSSFSDALRATASALVPSARQLPHTLQGTQTLLQGSALLPLSQIRPFVDASLPLSRTLPALSGDLKTEVPDLLASFKVLTYATNETAYSQGSGNPGFLYWLAWLAHNADSFISNSDANGPVWRGLLMATCPRLSAFPEGAILEAVLSTRLGCK